MKQKELGRKTGDMLFKTFVADGKFDKKVKFSTYFKDGFNLYKRKSNFFVEVNFIQNKHFRVTRDSYIKSFYEKFIEYSRENFFIYLKYNATINEVKKRFSFNLERIEKEDW